MDGLTQTVLEESQIDEAGGLACVKIKNKEGSLY